MEFPPRQQPDMTRPKKPLIIPPSGWTRKHDEYMKRKGIVRAYFVNDMKQPRLAGYMRQDLCVYCEALGFWMIKLDYCQYYLGFDSVRNLFAEFYTNNLKGTYMDAFRNPDNIAKYRNFIREVISLARHEEARGLKDSGWL